MTTAGDIQLDPLNDVILKAVDYIQNDTRGQYTIKRVEISPNGKYFLIEVELKDLGKSHFYLFDRRGDIIWSKPLLGDFYIFVGDDYIAGIDKNSKIVRIYRNNTRATVETHYIYPPDARIYLAGLFNSELKDAGVLILSTKDKKKVQGSMTSLPVHEFDILTLTSRMNFTGLKYYLNKVSREFFKINEQYWGLCAFSISNRYYGPLNRYQLNIIKFNPESKNIELINSISVNSNIKDLHSLDFSEVNDYLWGVAYDKVLKELILWRISDGTPVFQRVTLRNIDVKYIRLTTDPYFGLIIVYQDSNVGRLNFSNLSYDFLEDILNRKIPYLSSGDLSTLDMGGNISVTVSKSGKLLGKWDNFSGTIELYDIRINEKDEKEGDSMNILNSDDANLENDDSVRNMDSMIKELIETYGQVVLYGPPGTGKTHLARSIGQLDKNSEVKFVTFHKSYSYEDFVEGYRPDTNREGSIIYRVHDGIFKRLSIEAIYELLTDDIKQKILSKSYRDTCC